MLTQRPERTAHKERSFGRLTCLARNKWGTEDSKSHARHVEELKIKCSQKVFTSTYIYIIADLGFGQNLLGSKEGNAANMTVCGN